MLCDDLDECGGSGRERIYVCIWLIHDVIQQNLTHIAKQLHSSKKKKKKKRKAAESNDTENENYLYQRCKLRHRKVK